MCPRIKSKQFSFSTFVLLCFVPTNSRYTKQKWISEIIKYGIAGELWLYFLKIFNHFTSNVKFQKLL